MEKLLLLNPADADDLRYVNSLYNDGWNTDSEIPLHTDGGLRLFMHLSYCEGCATRRLDANDEDEDDYEAEKQRRLRELDQKFPPNIDDIQPF